MIIYRGNIMDKIGNQYDRSSNGLEVEYETPDLESQIRS